MKKWKIYLIGGIAILVAVLILLASVFIPMAMKKSDMGELLAKVQEGDLVAVNDPLYENGDVLGNKGKEVVLSDTELQEVKALLRTVMDSGYEYRQEKTFLGEATGLRLTVRIGEETVFLWFSEREFYQMQGELAICFRANNNKDYMALYQRLQELLATK